MGPVVKEVGQAHRPSSDGGDGPCSLRATRAISACTCPPASNHHVFLGPDLTPLLYMKDNKSKGFGIAMLNRSFTNVFVSVKQSCLTKMGISGEHLGINQVFVVISNL